jgi:cell division cycle 2-like
MSSKRSRWAEDEDEEDAELERKRKEKEEKKRAKLSMKTQETLQEQEQSTTTTAAVSNEATPSAFSEPPSRTFTPSKRRRISPPEVPERLFPLNPPEIAPSRSVDIYEMLNPIEEGSYGMVYRGRDTETGEIVALKKLKLEREKNGFPITSLREISTLMAARHPNIVNIREVVMGDSLKEYSHFCDWS